MMVMMHFRGTFSISICPNVIYNSLRGTLARLRQEVYNFQQEILQIPPIKEFWKQNQTSTPEAMFPSLCEKRSGSLKPFAYHNDYNNCFSVLKIVTELSRVQFGLK